VAEELVTALGITRFDWELETIVNKLRDHTERRNGGYVDR